MFNFQEPEPEPKFSRRRSRIKKNGPLRQPCFGQYIKKIAGNRQFNKETGNLDTLISENIFLTFHKSTTEKCTTFCFLYCTGIYGICYLAEFSRLIF